MPDKGMATEPPQVSTGETLETTAARPHHKIKLRHLYMISMGGKPNHIIMRFIVAQTARLHGVLTNNTHAQDVSGPHTLSALVAH